MDKPQKPQRESKQVSQQQSFKAKGFQRTANPALPLPAPVNRQQRIPEVLQKKVSSHPLVKQAERKPVTPAVYRPQPTPKILQRKSATAKQIEASNKSPHSPVAPAVYRPQAKKIVQPKLGVASRPRKNSLGRVTGDLHVVHGPVLSPFDKNPFSSKPITGKGGVIQRATLIGDTKDLVGESGTIHYHYTFDDTDINSLHITFADRRNYATRVWAKRSGYTPTGRDSGNWGALATNHGVPPAWASTLAGTRLAAAQREGLTAFHADEDIVALLHTAYPQVVPVNNLANFPPLGAPSALRFKESIRDMGDTTAGLMQLRPVTFFYRPEYYGASRTRQYGLIAEEVAQVYPELVEYTPEGEANLVRYHLLIAMLLNELQTGHLRVESLQRQFADQAKQIAEMMKHMAQLKFLTAGMEGNESQEAKTEEQSSAAIQ